jgi:hypothetical protein
MKQTALLVITDGGRKKFGFEENDCTVRALSLAGNISYAKAHKIAKDRGRKDLKAFNSFLLILEARKQGMNWKILRNGTKLMLFEGDTIAKFSKTHPKGRYLLCTRSHAVAVVDGVIHDTFDSRRRRIQGVWQLMK